jgi:hypothetical protein
VGSSAGIRLAGCEPLRNRPAGDRSGLLGIEARPACRLDLHGAQDRPSSGDQLGRDRRSVRLDQSVGIEAFVLVSGTRTHRSLSSEVSFRSFDAVRMLDQSRWHRHCPDVRARRGTVVGSGWSAGAFGWSLRPMLGEGVPLSGPIRGQTRPPDRFRVPVRSPGLLRRLQDDAAEYAESGGPRRGGRRCAVA